MELTLESAFSAGGIVGHISYLLLVISMMMNRLFVLRLLVIGSAMFAIVYEVVWVHDPVSVFWETVLVLVTITQLIITNWRNIRAQFDEKEFTFIKNRFPELSKGDCRKLLNAGSWLSGSSQKTLTKQGEAVTHLFYISKGLAKILINGKEVSECSAGNFIGEMTILTGEAATATTLLNGPFEYWAIDRQSCQNIMDRNPIIAREIDVSISRNYREKIMFSNNYLSRSRRTS